MHFGFRTTSDCPLCVETDKALRPISGDLTARPAGLHRHLTSGWLYVTTDEAERTPSNWDALTGKYLFFSPNLRTLLEVAEQELRQHDFHVSKVSPKPNHLGVHALCLYHSDDSRRKELAGRWREQYYSRGVQYRYWKTNEAALAGQYSELYRAR